jgi:hypothetical protein
MDSITSPPTITEDTKWAFDQMQKLLDFVKLQSEELEALKQIVANSRG